MSDERWVADCCASCRHVLQSGSEWETEYTCDLDGDIVWEAEMCEEFERDEEQ